MNFKHLILGAALIGCFNTFAGERGGNGGGGFCFGTNRCITTAEAGLQIPLRPKPFILAKELDKEIASILSRLPLENGLISAKELLEKSLGKRETFIPITKTGPAFDEVIKGYRRLMNEYGPGLPVDNFTLYAVSDQTDDVTYLLPAFFKLNIRSQSLILIHEALVRGNGANAVIPAIRIDGMIYQALTKGELDGVEFVLAQHEWKKATNSGTGRELMRALIQTIKLETGHPLKVSDLCEEAFGDGLVLYRDGGSFLSKTCEVSRAKAFAGEASIHPRFIDIFYGAIFKVGNIYNRPNRLTDLENDVCEGVDRGTQIFAVLQGNISVVVACDIQPDGTIGPIKMDFFNITKPIYP